jgi:ribosomal protein L29
MKRTSNIREMTTPDLVNLARDLASELAKFRSAKAGIGCQLPPGKAQGSTSWGLATKIKKDRARILTVLNERGIML